MKNKIDINEILKAKDIQTLKSHGSYLDIKRTVEEHIKFKLGVRSWKALSEKINLLRNNFSKNIESIKLIIKNSSFIEAKKKLKTILNINIKIQKKEDLNKGINFLINIFSPFDPFKKYEEIKFEDFKNSSRLEGIEIKYPDENITLEEILKKHNRTI